MDSKNTDDLTTSSTAKERVIQPSADFKRTIAPNEQVTPEEPETPKDSQEESTPFMEAPSLTLKQQAVVNIESQQADERNRPVSLRVKSLLAFGVLGLLATALQVTVYLNAEKSSIPAPIVLGISLVQFIVSVYFLAGKNPATVASVLKFYLVLSLITLPFSLLDPIGFVINAAMSIFIYYLRSRVKSLSPH